MCKKDRQKIKDYQKQFTENMTDEQKQKYKEAINKRDRDRYNKIIEKNIIKDII